MNFTITEDVFAKLPTLYVGAVVAKGVDNHLTYSKIEDLLDQNMAKAKARFAGVKVKESPLIVPYREAFRAIGINPNRFPCSAEAMFKRLANGHDLPHINPLVDLNNAISLGHAIPMGTHTLETGQDDIQMRFAQEGDFFIPLGKEVEEEPDEGEVVYAVGHEVRTRRWTWRQSQKGMITEDTTDVFFPIDGFSDFNKAEVDQALDELTANLKENFNCELHSGIVDRDHPTFSW